MGFFFRPALSLFLLSSLLFFSLSPPSSTPTPPPFPRRSLLLSPNSTCSSQSLPITYSCLPYGIPTLTLILLLFFYILVTTAQHHFTPVVSSLCSHLSLSPSMAAVSLLALGNGAPDVFSSLSALRSGHPRTGLGAILSAGAFVSAFVVGFVAINAAPFSVDPAPFVRDVLFYLTSALFLFYVYLSGELFLWQAIAFVAFYLFFVGLVFWMDLGPNKDAPTDDAKFPRVSDDLMLPDCENGGSHKLLRNSDSEGGRPDFGIRRVFHKISKIWEVPVSLLLKLTIPQPLPSEWNRFYSSANIALCPLALLYSCSSFIPMNHPLTFLLPGLHLPLWLVTLFSTSCLAILHYIIEKEPPKSEQVPVVLVAFVMSVFWISNVAGELLNCLAALGELLELPPALLGLTVLAWGNSVGDLVADVALAKAGQPTLAMAGCFAGPMFNMLCGLGMALVVQTANVYPEAYALHFHISIVVAFVFLILSLMGTLLVVTWCRFRVPRFWGFCLVGLYVFFMAVSLIIAQFSS